MTDDLQHFLSPLVLPGLSSAQGLPGQDAGARPSSAGDGQRAPQTRLPDEGRPAVLHRPADEAEQDEMRHVTTLKKISRLWRGQKGVLCRFRCDRVLLHTAQRARGGGASPQRSKVMGTKNPTKQNKKETLRKYCEL